MSHPDACSYADVSGAAGAAPDLGALLAGVAAAGPASNAPVVAPVEDAAFAAAYDAVGPVDRARLKTCIARLHALHARTGPAHEVREGRCSTNWRQGFSSAERTTPCAWTLICVHASWASGPRLLAALLPALFAGVGSVAVLRMDGCGHWPAQVLASLELAGQEVVADMASQGLEDLLSRLIGADRQEGGHAAEHAGMQGGSAGRLVLLGGDAHHWQDVFALSRRFGVPLWHDGIAPMIGLADCGAGDGDDAGAPDVALLRAAHPDASFVRLPAMPCSAPDIVTGIAPDAVACLPRHAQAWLERAPLVLGPGHEWCWAHPGLHVAWFARRALALLPGPPDRRSSHGS